MSDRWRRWLLTLLPVLFGLMAIIASVLLVAGLSMESDRLARIIPWLLGFCLLALLLLVVALIDRMLALLGRRRRREPGARLRWRLTLLFVALTVPPAAVVYAFSLQFLHQTVDSWFDVGIEQAMEDAVAIGQQHLEQRSQEAIRQTREASAELVGTDGTAMIIALGRQRQRLNAEELAVFDSNGRLQAARFRDASRTVPSYPDQASLLQASSRRVFALTEPSAEGLNLRVLVRLEGEDGPVRVLQAIHSMPSELVARIERIEAEYSGFRQLDYLRGPLKLSLSLVLSLVLVFTLLLATLAALTVSRRLVQPLGELARATAGVVEGQYRQLPLPGNDELGFLVRAFNRMNRELAQASEQTRSSRLALESEKAYLQAVLSRLSSGVLIVDHQLGLQAGNDAASSLLQVDLEQELDRPLSQLAERYPALAELFAVLAAEAAAGTRDWRQELALVVAGRRRLLLVRGTAFTVPENEQPVFVAVFDDITVLIEAQRQAAWGEVARRLAHEVKNPLTPIQLAAERLRHRLLGRLPEDQADMLDRATRTIVGQVDSLKAMVDAFSDYARPPRLSPRPIRLAELLGEVIDLYRAAESPLAIDLDIQPSNLGLRADRERLRQVFNNLIANALDATKGQSDARLQVRARAEYPEDQAWLRLEFVDNGPGFCAEMLGRLFEPYATTKVGGTGLGLAIVRKIIEEHGGTLGANNVAEGGARLTLRLPMDALATPEASERTHGKKTDSGSR